MKKNWSKPTMCEVAAGFEISRYLPAEVAPKKQLRKCVPLEQRDPGSSKPGYEDASYLIMTLSRSGASTIEELTVALAVARVERRQSGANLSLLVRLDGIASAIKCAERLGRS